MQLKNHIAYRFMTDESIWMEILEGTYPKEFDKLKEKAYDDKLKDPDAERAANQVRDFYHLLTNRDQKSYYISETVMDKMDLLKLNKRNDKYDWTVFRDLTDRKVTFIMPGNHLLRMRMSPDMIEFIHLTFELHPVEKRTKTEQGEMKWVMFYVNRTTGEQCDYFQHIDVKSIEKFIYTLLCFMYLTTNDEVILQPGHKHGTRKQGKIINEFKIPLTIVNSRWNTDIHRTTGFDVSGHFAIRWSGVGRSQARIVFIQPFKKEGYSRKSGKKLEEQK